MLNWQPDSFLTFFFRTKHRVRTERQPYFNRNWDPGSPSSVNAIYGGPSSSSSWESTPERPPISHSSSAIFSCPVSPDVFQTTSSSPDSQDSTRALWRETFSAPLAVTRSSQLPSWILDSMSKKPDEGKNPSMEKCPDLFREALRHRVDLFMPVIESFLSDPLASREGVDLFVRHGGADVNGKTEDGTPFLLAALDNNHPRAFRWLITQPGVQLDPKDKRGRTPFLAAVIQGNLPAVQALAARKLKIDLSGKEGQTALDWVTGRCDGKMLNYLLDWWGENLPGGFLKNCWERIQRQDTTRRFYQSLSPEVRSNFIRDEIVHYGRPIKLQTMHGAGYSLDKGDPVTGMTPLHIAAKEGRMDIARALMTAGVKLDQTNQKKQTPLMLAALHGHPDILKMLIDLGADAHRQDQDGDTALIHIFRNPKGISFDACQALVKTLIDAHADVNHRNKKGTTALHWAAFARDKDQVRLLLDQQANPHIQDNFGNTPLTYAENGNGGEDDQAVLSQLRQLLGRSTYASG